VIPEITTLTIAELGPQIKTGKISPVELTELYLQRIEKLDPMLNAFVTVTAEQARSQAKVLQKEITERKYRGPLHGIPITIKDNLATKGIRTTAGSKILSDWVPDFDATVVTRLRNAGAIILGKTNMHEWAKASNTINRFFGAIHNPWNLNATPGGSSGGPAVAVAADMCLASIGTDSAGSVRTPASLCGIVGLKPTYGRISQHGGVPGTGGHSINHFGVFTKTIQDCAHVLEVVAGHDPQDPLSVDVSVPRYTDALGGCGDSLKIGIVDTYFPEIMSREVRQAFDAALRTLESLGMKLELISIPHMDLVTTVFACTMRFEDIAPHDRYLRTRPRDYSPRLLYNQISALTIPETTYQVAQKVRRLICREFEEALAKVDLIVTPTMPITAPSLEDCDRGYAEIDGRSVPLQDSRGNFLTLFTIPFNLTGLPAVSVCCGFSSAGLPIGLQLIGRPFEEGEILRAAQIYEQAVGYYKKRPQLPLTE
jgi:aspartyl-tRNA(Asn)/glutamyl-tRNA(Gln) amidotransferase subunit A